MTDMLHSLRELEHPVPWYEKHAGTVQVSGKSESGKVARYLVYLLLQKQEVTPELFFIGANAGHQAYKAALIAADIMKTHHQTAISFLPMRVRTHTEKRTVTGEVVKDESGNMVMEEKDAFLWRVVKPVAVP